MDAQVLNGYIRQEIRKEVYADHIELYLPFFFGNGITEPLCLVWDRNGVSDGGRTLRELKKRVGDLTPYRETIRNILNSHAYVALEGGQNLVARHFQTCVTGEETYLDYTSALSHMLRVISQISVADTIRVDEDGTVYVC